MSDELMNRARTLLAQHEVDSWLDTRNELRMADTIRDLLAEVKRLTEMRDKLTGQAVDLIAEVERLQWLRDNLMTDANVFRSRAEAAESRLRELASAEPVAWLYQRDETGMAVTFANDGVNNPENFGVNNPRLSFICALIRRPEMPS